MKKTKLEIYKHAYFSKSFLGLVFAIDTHRPLHFNVEKSMLFEIKLFYFGAYLCIDKMI